MNLTQLLAPTLDGLNSAQIHNTYSISNFNKQPTWHFSHQQPTTLTQQSTFDKLSTSNEHPTADKISTLNEQSTPNKLSTFNEHSSPNKLSTLNENFNLNKFSALNDKINDKVKHLPYLNFDTFETDSFSSYSTVNSSPNQQTYNIPTNEEENQDNVDQITWSSTAVFTKSLAINNNTNTLKRKQTTEKNDIMNKNKKLNVSPSRRIKTSINTASDNFLKFFQNKELKADEFNSVEKVEVSSLTPQNLVAELKDNSNKINLPIIQEDVKSSKKFLECGSGCGRKFKSKSHLIRHERMHSGEKPYKCSHEGCNKSFSRRDNMSQHFVTHTGEKKKGE
ncbi:hypothetical protein HK099_004928, partial [Clydaea vesicula]